MVLWIAFAWQHDRAVEVIREAAVATTDHHGADHQLAENGELARQRRHDGWMA